MLSNITTGTATSAAANIDIELGYLPSKVEVQNVTTGAKFEWFSGEAQGTARDARGTGVQTAAPGGVTHLNAAFQGIRLGTGVVGAAGNVIQWVAYRMGPGSGR